MKKYLILIIGVLLVAGGVLFATSESWTVAIMGRVAETRMASTMIDDLPDGLHVLLCGAGSPLPDADRSGPCTAVVAGDTILIFDAGSGGARQLGAMNFPLGEIDALFLTHFHSDHIDGLGEMMLQRWVNGAHQSPLPIYGPPGVDRVVAGFNAAYAQDVVHRIAHHGAETVPPSGAGGKAQMFPPLGPDNIDLVFAKGDEEGDELTIHAFNVAHDPVSPAVGYLVRYKDRSIVISGDTAKSKMVEQAAQNVDLLVHEALSPVLVGVMTDAARKTGRTGLAKITADIVDYHTSPTDAAQIAHDAHVGMLLFTHIVPALPLAPMKRVFLQGVSDIYDGPVAVGQDGTFVSLPAGTKDSLVDLLK